MSVSPLLEQMSAHTQNLPHSNIGYAPLYLLPSYSSLVHLYKSKLYGKAKSQYQNLTSVTTCQIKYYKPPQVLHSSGAGLGSLGCLALKFHSRLAGIQVNHSTSDTRIRYTALSTTLLTP